MQVLILGAAGMVGRRLAQHLLASGRLGDQPVSRITAFDMVPADLEAGASGIDLKIVTGDVSDEATVRALVADRPDVIFHLAAVVSGEAEANFDKGYRINLDGTRHLFEAIRAEADYRPRVVYTSSIAVFGAPFGDKIGDEFLTAPLTSYGTQKMIGELLLNDYSRRGIFDGIGIRLPTIVVRPGKPNKAASSFFSGIIREPLAGVEADLPVDDDVRHWVASPDSAVGYLVHGATMDLEPVGPRRCLTMPGLSVTVAEMLAALRDVAGEDVAARVRRKPDETIRRIVAGWPRDFDATRAAELGFVTDASFHDIIRAHQRETGHGLA
ncbi:D-erythronate dehydrogenase [uncultured Paracoccus sp.]|uniref:D-erythronate dehydrogenase n=1 Tax=uncultured Paracoccus sp. TaxID=189685 RepID=UPI0026085A29|nr:D-erythronate dehydrogenase [uncultured Paracoccus sp.]